MSVCGANNHYVASTTYVSDKEVRPEKITFSGHLTGATQSRALNPGESLINCLTVLLTVAAALTFLLYTMNIQNIITYLFSS